MLWADSAYQSEEAAEMFKARGYDNRIQARAYRDWPLTLTQKMANRQRSTIRVRVEHVYGFRQATQTNRAFGADYFQKQTEAVLGVRVAN